MEVAAEGYIWMSYIYIYILTSFIPVILLEIVIRKQSGMSTKICVQDIYWGAIYYKKIIGILIILV